VCPTHGFIPRNQVDERRADSIREARVPGVGESFAIVRRLGDVEREEIEWLWDKRIPRGKITVLDGDPEVGKSYLSLAIASAVTLGTALPDGDPGLADGVLILTAEDGLGDTVRPRAEDMGADLRKIHCLTAVATSDGKTKHFSLADDLPALEGYLQSCPISLVIIDPINAYLGASIDTNKDAALRSVLTPVAELAERFRVAVLVIRHLTKGNRDKAIYRGQGSIAYVAAARSVLLAGKNPADETERAIVCIKNNLAEHPTGTAFEIREGQFRWKGPTTLTAEDLLRPESGDGRSAVDEAVDFLKEALGNGARPINELGKEAKPHGISPAALGRARKKIGIKSRRIGEAGKRGGGVWLWSLPENETASDLDDQDDHLENLITLTRSESESDLDQTEVDHLNQGDPAACVDCSEAIPAGSTRCTACRVKLSPLTQLAIEFGGEVIVRPEEQALQRETNTSATTP